jgi:N-acetylglucosamine malate deacetylase 1
MQAWYRPLIVTEYVSKIFVLSVLLACPSFVYADSDGSPSKVVVFGGHPDDPESGCGGLIATLTAAGHEVHVGYATCFRGDRKINGQPEADVRRHEAAEACRILGARPHFFPYAHEKLVVDQATLDEVSAWLKAVQPDVVVTHWPLDMHPNHHVASSLIWQCYQRDGGWNLYFFEVMTGSQTLAFKPDLYLDLAPVLEKKKACLEAHTSQNPASIWAAHDKMHHARGRECGVERAEAYLLLEAKPGVKLLPVNWRRPAEPGKITPSKDSNGAATPRRERNDSTGETRGRGLSFVSFVSFCSTFGFVLGPTNPNGETIRTEVNEGHEEEGIQDSASLCRSLQ